MRLIEDGKRGDQLEPIDLISATSSAIVEIPISYPDKGLPWLYAKQLLGMTYNGRIIVPIVIDGAALRPPLHNLHAELERRAPGIIGNSQLVPVAIVTDLSFSNDRRAKFILDEIEESGIVSFIIGNGAHKAFFVANRNNNSWKTYALCDVSFSSIVAFISSQFEIDILEAEVIAIRLSNTFRAFNISVHPSYFAGIPREMLSRLSNANHRAELIDLAVTGFLSFIGAGDTKDITLKQRTRRLFLRNLAYDMVVEKIEFSMSTLYDYVKAYSGQYDFALNVNEFIQSLISNGILHEREDRIHFSINFIQNYLLAERLASEPVAAEKYFNPSLTEIDFSTFELYAEIGLSKKVLEDVLRRLDVHVSQFSKEVGATDYTKHIEDRCVGSYKSSGHYLVNGSIKPSLLRNLERSANYQRRVEKAAKDLIGANSNFEGKQKILDLAHRAAEEVSVKFEHNSQNGAREFDKRRNRTRLDDGNCSAWVRCGRA